MLWRHSSVKSNNHLKQNKHVSGRHQGVKIISPSSHEQGNCRECCGYAHVAGKKSPTVRGDVRRRSALVVWRRLLTCADAGHYQHFTAVSLFLMGARWRVVVFTLRPKETLDLCVRRCLTSRCSLSGTAPGRAPATCLATITCKTLPFFLIFFYIHQ